MKKKLNRTAKDYTILTETMSQPGDHNKEDGITLKQRIKLLIPDNVEDNPAVFFVLGNESAITDEKLAGLYSSYGRRKDMIFINAEHRGYGQSITNDKDQTVPAYVKIEQALADFHAVAEKYRCIYPGAWIAAGYSYGGGLAINYAYKYPRDIQVVLSSSGVTDWGFDLDTYDIQVRENLGEGLYGRLIKHVDCLGACIPFGQNWQDRELLYSYVTAVSQYKGYYRSFKWLVNLLSCLPTKQFLGLLRFLDSRLAKGAGGEYVASNSKQSLSREEAMSGKYSWRVWRYQQCTETGTFWKASHPSGLYRNTREDWIIESMLLFGQAPPLLECDEWKVREMVDKLTVPLVYVNGGKDPWKRVCLPVTHQIRNGTYIFLEDDFHCPDREEPEKGIKVINEVFRYIQ